MIKEFKIPSPGESITEVEIAHWMVSDGAYVNKNDELAEVESDKATLILVAEESGTISIKACIGERVAVGSIAYTIDTAAEKPAQAPHKEENNNRELNTEEKKESPEANANGKPLFSNDSNLASVKVTPLAAEMMKANHLNIDDIINGLQRIGKHEVELVIQNKACKTEFAEPIPYHSAEFTREEERQNMSMLRRKLSERLVKVKNETAMLTTFNEVDMSALMALRSNLQNRFVEKHGFKLGYMGFFTKAVSIAALHFPMVNARLEAEDIVSHQFVDVGIAVQSPKGLMVPIVRNAESKSVVQIEKDIKELAQKASERRISIEELSGGTISITNGGVFGSLLSTPIINPPQSAILGMHNIVERPVALNGQVVIRPMMYLALSYDHRIIDGKDSVGFLKMVKELVETPSRMLFNGTTPEEKLMDL